MDRESQSGIPDTFARSEKDELMRLMMKIRSL